MFLRFKLLGEIVLRHTVQFELDYYFFSCAAVTVSRNTANACSRPKAYAEVIEKCNIVVCSTLYST